jgi:hypothetical protein
MLLIWIIYILIFLIDIYRRIIEYSFIDLCCGNLSWSTNKFLRNILLCTWILSFIYWKPNAKDSLRISLIQKNRRKHYK